MSDTKISALSAITSSALTDIIPIVQSGGTTTKKIALSNLTTFGTITIANSEIQTALFSGTIGIRLTNTYGSAFGSGANILFGGPASSFLVGIASVYTTYGSTYGGAIVIGTNAGAGSGVQERLRVTAVGNLKIAGTADRATTEGTNHLDIFDGTAPVGTLANGISLYSTAGELRVMDAAGNATLLSPHEKKTNFWIYDSVDTVTGKHLKIDMERMMKAINEKFGWNFVHEYAVK